MWFEQSIVYQIYPLGLCGAPLQNDGIEQSRILRINDWVPHLKKLGVDCVYLSPLFESDAHGYDTRDYMKCDCRLGSNEDLASVCDTLHKAGIRILFDGVFNHVGRGFWAFEDVKQHRGHSRYKDWFLISFDGNSNYNDGFWYEGWEGHFELVKLNLGNHEVVDYLLSCVGSWMDSYKIDGLRLDVAYSLDESFLRRLRSFATDKSPDFVLVGEMLHGDYNRLVNNEMLHSATNYECYKGLHSAFNSMNMFEIGHSIARQFGPEQWTLYKGTPMLSFVDNHDVSRIATLLANKEQLVPLYGLLLTMPGVPCIYYGSEWGVAADKQEGDAALRPDIAMPDWNSLTDHIAALAAARHSSEALQRGSYRTILLTNKQFIFERISGNERVLVAINIDAEPFTAHFDAQAGCAEELITGSKHDFGGGSVLAPYSVACWRVS